MKQFRQDRVPVFLFFSPRYSPKFVNISIKSIAKSIPNTIATIWPAEPKPETTAMRIIQIIVKMKFITDAIIRHILKGLV